MTLKNERLNWLEKNKEQPRHMRAYYKIPLSEFESRVFSYDSNLIDSIYAGDVYIIRNVVNPDVLDEMKRAAIAWGKERAPVYERMVVGAKDFHQIIMGEGDAKKYAIQPVRHSYFSFRWNGDPLHAFKNSNHIWGIVKVFGGFDYDSFTKDFSDELPVDRSQIAHYPPGAGLIPRHNDPWHNQKLILGVYMSKHGEDFKQGGIYFVDKDDKDILLEPEIEKGDAVVAYATITHGVQKVDPHKEPDWGTDKGRWFLGLYTNDSSAKKDRLTSKLA